MPKHPRRVETKALVLLREHQQRDGAAPVLGLVSKPERLFRFLRIGLKA